MNSGVEKVDLQNLGRVQGIRRVESCDGLIVV
jgi:hypothetical protein